MLLQCACVTVTLTVLEYTCVIVIIVFSQGQPFLPFNTVGLSLLSMWNIQGLNSSPF